ncbi:MAG: hypothetical protein H0V97_00160 [Actinobacteria bacterium]|nr:hypothetical protein [Actinomycetota bacterium]
MTDTYVMVPGVEGTTQKSIGIAIPILDPTLTSKGPRGYRSQGTFQDATYFMGTYAKGPWMSPGSVLLTVHAITKPVIERGYRYTCRLYESFDGNRLVWQAPTAVLSSFTQDVYDTVDAILDSSNAVWRTLIDRAQGVDSRMGEATEEASPLPGSPADVAREVRELSGLTSEAVGDIFPVARESYQRWISGRSTPAAADVRRLLALRHLLRDLKDRVPDVRSWLLSPVDQGSALTPYDLLKQARIGVVWDLGVEIPSQKLSRTYRRDGEVVLRVERSTRANSRRTRLQAEDLDDLSDVDDDE